ncbi:bifunctional transcriptional activator/DNA repair enzyme AdaA [Loktanella sp. S4079]|uniref:bifunctional transcriptional activator/DNA repair enzyme AdaA n=1 Tax=Loktanella sp. S4079 TaxID=579483 RepID=UPI0005FA12C0|nr:trifunctional transcriptional activator/DNA repair protein Ada/methylated-DNA--[protein]-cysteine S-methyltransferase [Loktanella sp. S4079]KJZ19996.1 6-O-methylguanine DNA methyltransferase [Loktanella sp. S4079]
MLMNLPDHDTLYTALLARDPAFDGTAYVGVSSTGIFCRLTCPARKPKRENCHFYATTSACIDAGYRPCKRCNPISPAAKDDPMVQPFLAALDRDPTHRWSETDIATMGYDPSTIRRSFKRYFGMTFLEMARKRRLAHGFTALETGRVIDAQLESGFDSASAFRKAFAKLLGTPPNSFRANATLRATHIPTPMGDMIAVCDESSVHLLEFADRKALPAELNRLRKIAKDDLGVGRYSITDVLAAELNAYFAGKSAVFSVPLTLHGTAFQRQIWHSLRDIPPGQTRSYQQLAQKIGAPNATRAVARANGANQIALIVPCHRIIGADGSLTGYGGGLWRKRQLIDLEKQFITKALQ